MSGVNTLTTKDGDPSSSARAQFQSIKDRSLANRGGCVRL